MTNTSKIIKNEWFVFATFHVVLLLNSRCAVSFLSVFYENIDNSVKLVFYVAILYLIITTIFTIIAFLVYRKHKTKSSFFVLFYMILWFIFTVYGIISMIC